MTAVPLPEEARRAAELIGKADIVIGIPSYNNGRTIGHVVKACHAGLVKYFPQLTGVIVNSDGGSTDNTREAALSAQVEDNRLMLLSTPLMPLHRLSVPYDGIPGKGSAFRMVFQMAEKLHAKACAVVDSDLRSITPEWIGLLLQPVLTDGYDFVAPYYHRHKYDGTITNSIVYPLTRALYGLRVRQPIGGDFGISARLCAQYLQRDDWETDVARYGIDVWMTTIAIADGFRVCQSFLGAKLHDAKDPGSDLSAMLEQVVGSVFLLMREYTSTWRVVTQSRPVDLFGFRYDVGVDPIEVDMRRMISAFCRGCRELEPVWSLALHKETIGELKTLQSACERSIEVFHLRDDLWTRVVLDFACAYNRETLSRGLILRSLTPLYLGRVASFVQETRMMGSAAVEEKIEQLCLKFEALKPYLVARWNQEVASRSDVVSQPKLERQDPPPLQM